MSVDNVTQKGKLRRMRKAKGKTKRTVKWETFMIHTDHGELGVLSYKREARL